MIDDLSAEEHRLLQLLDENRARQLTTTSTATLATQRGVAPSTVFRQKAAALRGAPTISRRSRTYTEDSGRVYGEVDAGQQRQSDAGPWRVGAAIRQQLEPLTIAVDGVVVRIYEVKGWTRNTDPEGGGWVADLGNLMSSADLDATYPYRIGDALPTHAGGAYLPHWF